MNAVRLWWGMSRRWQVVLYPLMMLFPISVLSSENNNPFSLAFIFLWITAVVGAGHREDEAYASLNVSRRVWAKHRRADLLLSIPIYLGILWALPTGSVEQIFFGIAGLIRPLRVLLKRDLRPLGSSYIGETLAQRATHADTDSGSAKAKRKWWPWQWIKYSDTPVGQGILEPQVTAWFGWGVGMVLVALVTALLGWIFDISAPGIFAVSLMVSTMAMGFTVEQEIQRSYAHWIRFGGARAVWARWTALLCAIPIYFAALIGGVLGVVGALGVTQGLLYGLGYVAVLVPALVLLAVAGKNNAVWIVLGIAATAVGGALGLAGIVSVTQWFLFQGALGLVILLGLPWLIRGSAHEFWGLGAFFGLKQANADQT